MKPDKITITQMPDSDGGGYTLQNFQIIVERFGLKKTATEHKMIHANRLAYDLWIQLGREANE